jgi:hypothetical protein
VRTSNHDNFGLAVIIFQMLFMARHPFSGRFLGTGEMPMERAISEYRFVYGTNAAAMQMERPPASLGLNGVTQDLALLFERAFSRQGSQPNGRPRPDEWVIAPQDLEKHLRTCGVNSAHQFTDTLGSCPWCEIEAITGAPLFQVLVMGSAQAGFTIAALWAKMNSVPDPGPSPPLPGLSGLTTTLSPAALELQGVGFGRKLTAGLLSLVGIPSRIHSLKTEIDRKAGDARDRWQKLQNNWENYTNSKEFQDRLVDLRNLRSEYDALPQKRLQELNKLEANKYRLQLNAHLDGCRIAHARIRGVGVAKKAMLQSYGIETAADIVDYRVLAVPGFGPKLLSTLKQWRDQQQRRFVFDPNKGIDQIAKNAVEQQILTEKADLERKFHEGLAKLSFGSNQIMTRRRAVLAQAEQAARDLAQAEADLRASSAISPIVPRKRAIAALGAAAGLTVVALLSDGPSRMAPYQMPQQLHPQEIRPTATSLPPPVRRTTPTHAENDANGQLHPEDGYDWVDGNRVGVRWVRGKMSQKYPHLIASDTEGEWQPDDGYDWANLTNVKDKLVRWVPGIPSTRYLHIVAAEAEGQWRLADGYTWVVSPPRPGDMRVMPARTVDDLRAAINVNVSGSNNVNVSGSNNVENLDRTPQGQSGINPPSQFEAGLADRSDWERWVAGLSGEFRRGAEWWASHRSLSHPGSCDGPAATSLDFGSGCETGKARLTPTDLKRKSIPEYRRGWNNYNGAISPPPASDLQASPAKQGASQTPQGSDPESADRLNAQELNHLKNQ